MRTSPVPGCGRSWGCRSATPRPRVWNRWTTRPTSTAWRTSDRVPPKSRSSRSISQPPSTLGRCQMTIVALAGRRIDADGAQPARFPLQHAARVRHRLDELFTRVSSTSLVSSAACGADLLAQEAAGALRLDRWVVLPFDRTEFRRRSVVDRPGDWGQRFDRLIDDLAPQGHIVNLGLPPDAADAYRQANEAILAEA